MAEESNELGESLINFVKHMVRGHVIYEGTVIDVDSVNFTADCNINGVTFYAVPLKVVTGSQASFVEIPSVGANVLLSFRDGNIQRPQIISIDKSDKLLITMSTLVQFNQGQLGGLVDVIALTTKLNNIENLLNNLITLFNTHTHNVTAVGSPTGPSILQESGTLTPTQRANIEDTTIIH